MRRRNVHGRGSSRRFAFKKREYIWATISSAGPGLTQGGTIFDEFILVSKGDWARDASLTAHLEKGATLLRVVGDVWFYSSPATPADERGQTKVQCIFGLLKRDEDDASPLDIAVDAYSEEWMTLQSFQLADFYDPVATLTAGWGERRAGAHVDVRVKRKLTSEDTVKACFLANRVTLGTDTDVAFLLRALIQLP